MIRIAIVDDHAMVRAGLRQFFAEQLDFSVVAEAESEAEAGHGRDAMEKMGLSSSSDLSYSALKNGLIQ